MNLKHLLLTATVMAAVNTFASALTYVNPVAPEFPILAWYSVLPDSAQTPQRYEELRDAGFNISFSHFKTNEQLSKALDVAKDAGIKIMATSKPLYSDTQNTVEAFRDHQSLAGWFLRDEPVASAFNDLSDFRDRIVASDSTHLLYLNLFPIMVSAEALGTRDYEDYVERFVNEVRLPLISYDFYPIIVNDTTGGVTIREQEHFNNLETIRRVALRHGIPFWAFCLTTAHTPYPIPTPVHLRYEAFTALAYGAQALQYFTYWQPSSKNWNFHHAPIDETGKRTDIYYIIRDLNKEIQALSSVFLGAEIDDIAFSGENIPEGTKPLSELPLGFGDISTDGIGVLVSQFHNGSCKYLMLVNRDINHAQTVRLPRPAGLTIINPDGTKTPDITPAAIIIAPGSYHLLKL